MHGLETIDSQIDAFFAGATFNSFGFAGDKESHKESRRSLLILLKNTSAPASF